MSKIERKYNNISIAQSTTCPKRSEQNKCAVYKAQK